MVARHVLTILAVRDLAVSLPFYRDAFGWSVSVQTPVYAELALPGGMRFGLYQRDGFSRNTTRPASSPGPGETTATEIYLYVDDLPSAVERALAAGAIALSPAAHRDWGDEVACVADLDGNVLALAVEAPPALPA